MMRREAKAGPPKLRRAGMTTLGAAGAAVAALAVLAGLRAFLAGQAPPSPLPGGAAAIGAAAAVGLLVLAAPFRWFSRRHPTEPLGEDRNAGDRF
jgi:hypothetical protein